jgi:thiamine-monophosphate kinase
LRLSEIGEFGFIRGISERVGTPEELLVGIGDDCAVTSLSPGMVLLSTSDMLVEGVHFDLAWSDPHTLGRKSLSVNLSDIAAMGGIPKFALLSVAIPPELPLEFLDRFIEGFIEQAGHFGVTLAGGDTSSSRGGFVISVTLQGEQYPELVVRRSGACAGDIICVSGTLGDSALGLDMLRKGERSGAAVMRHLDPVPRSDLGRCLAEASIPSSMIDVSDGLLADLGHILAQSGKGAIVTIDSLPLSSGFKLSIASSSHEYHRFPLSGGEDYELVFTLPPERLDEARSAAEASGTAVTVIGEITTAGGILLVDSKGGHYTPETSGYDHFANV